MKIRGSYVEVYNEELRDLLDPAPKKLHIREDATRGIFVDGARQVSLSSVEDAVTLLERGVCKSDGGHKIERSVESGRTPY